MKVIYFYNPGVRTIEGTYEVDTYVYVPFLKRRFLFETIQDNDCKVLMTKVHKELYLNKVRHPKRGLKEIWHYMRLS